MDYSKLKSLLRENEDNPRWTEDDENKFCEEMFNVQLDKVAAFQEKTFKELEARTDKAAGKLQDLAPEDGKLKGELTTGRFKEVEEELDSIINETKELKKFSNINYTGFLKIVSYILVSLWWFGRRTACSSAMRATASQEEPSYPKY
jgi:SPX domain protein involved in polyphosphate accumulation